MIKGLRIICISLLLITGSSALAQTDSSKAQIQKEALQMRATLNKYLSDQLLTNDLGGKSDVKSAVIDSISNIIAHQKVELEMLKLSIQGIEKVISDVKQQQLASEGSNILIVGAKRLDENQLELYFPFDGSSLTSAQIVTLDKFFANRKAKKVQLTGYSDWVGTEKYNKKLAQRRCNSVKQNIPVSSMNIAMAEPIVAVELSISDASYFRKVLISIK
ncbi:MAG: OmpA family protein [bacterium]|nr:OmpA family protein [bacterium]